MLIDGQKWACEACIRGHHRPLIRIKRKGRPFATCSVCQATPCKSPLDHARQKRETELKHPKKASHARLYPRHHNPNGFQPIAPRPTSGAGGEGERSASTSTSAEDSNPNTTAVGERERLNSSSSSQMNISSTATTSTADSVYGEGYWSGSEASGNESCSRTLSAATATGSATGGAGPSQTISHSAPGTCVIDPSIMGNTIFDPMYSLLPSSSDALMQPGPLISPLDSANPFEFPLDPELTVNGTLGCLEDMDLDITEGLEEVFHVEDWSRYMWSPETGFEHLDMGYPPVTR
ncbi:hypothetical protein N7504_000151 [Penicillium tannophilum]|nr:hypothetical protein N7504_000151 [Penicillium tannophilum]